MSELKIAQADRDARETLWREVRKEWIRTAIPFPIREIDEAFARHRIAAEEGKAELVRALADSERELTRSTALLEHISSTPGYGSDQNSEAELLDHVSCGNAVLGKARAALARVRGEG